MKREDEKHDVFISYSTKNSDVANKVCYVLEQNNLKCWIAPRNISSGRIYLDEIADAIKSTKIVVLIYSADSQESKYVNNEINMAFTNNKKILSFNIDNSLPREDMEYYLKINQWLAAYPDPETEFEKLVMDARDLCDDAGDTPVLVDMSNFNDKELSMHKKDYVSLILLFTPFYWASFIYMGLTSNKKLWTLMGLVYLIPTIIYLMIRLSILNYLFVLYSMMSLFRSIFVIFWILAIIHGFVIRNEYLTRKSVLRFTSADKDLFNYLYDEYLRL